MGARAGGDGDRGAKGGHREACDGVEETTVQEEAAEEGRSEEELVHDQLGGYGWNVGCRTERVGEGLEPVQVQMKVRARVGLVYAGRRGEGKRQGRDGCNVVGITP
eukprot:2235269-Rhodomonas_salina.2